MKKALVIRLSSAGDILITHPLVAALKHAGYETHLLCREKFAPAAKAAGADRVIGYSSGAGSAKSLSAEKYDALIDAQGNLRSFLLGMSVKCGVKKRCNKNPFRRRMMLLFKWFLGDKKSVSEKYVEAAAGLTGGHGAGKPSPRVNLKNKKTVDILVHDGAKWKNKRWPYVLELATELLKLRKTRVTLTGVKDEVDNSGGLLYHNSRRFKNLVGKTDFAGLLEEIRRTDIFVGNDTAAAHAAALYGKPAIIFLGPTVQAFGFITGRDFIVLENKGLMCRPCHLHGGDKCPIGSFDCMRSISVGSALEAVKKIISRGN